MKRFLLATGIALVAASAALPAAAQAPADAAPPRAAMMFWFLDRNNDGFIDATEIEAFRTARFQSMDADGDGKLTKAEASQAMAAGHRPHHARKASAEGKGPAEAGKKAERAEMREKRAAKREERMLKRLGFSDTVETITIVEFVAKDSPMMKRADANSDGKISKAEFLAAREKGPRPGQKGAGPDAN